MDNGCGEPTFGRLVPPHCRPIYTRRHSNINSQLSTLTSLIFPRPVNQLSSPLSPACRIAYSSSRNAGTKLPGPRTYSFPAAFSAAISYISSPDSTARSLSERCTVKKHPEIVPTAQPVCVTVSLINAISRRTYPGDLSKKLVSVLDRYHTLPVAEVVHGSRHEDDVSWWC